MCNKCTVTYEFDTSASASKLALRYLVIVNGAVVRANGDKPRALDAHRKIVAVVAPGSKVALFLNSDVHPDFRQHPVYAVQVGQNDVHVKITERKGRIGHESATPSFQGRMPGSQPGKLIDVYSASLTGDIWMQISHVYTADEADTMLPADVDATIRAAVRRIYQQLPSNELLVQFPASDSAPKQTLRMRFTESDNVLANTTYCPLLVGVLPRVHPRAFAALMTEARACGVLELRVTSGWRPMLGSIVHRAGLGLDIDYAESNSQRVSINRAALIAPTAARNDNVSEREQAFYADYEQAKKDAAAKEKDLEMSRAQLARNRDSSATDRLQQQEASADDKFKDAKDSEQTAMKAWNKERDRHEPSLIHTLREKLGKNKLVDQVLDPWYININTHGHTPAVPNEQLSQDEKTHNNHLHITVIEPKIL